MVLLRTLGADVCAGFGASKPLLGELWENADLEVSQVVVVVAAVAAAAEVRMDDHVGVGAGAQGAGDRIVATSNPIKNRSKMVRYLVRQGVACSSYIPTVMGSSAARRTTIRASEATRLFRAP